MFLSKPGSNKSATIEALVPMIDLFAVLAIVFMIYSSDEIVAAQEKSQETIEQIATEYKSCRKRSPRPKRPGSNAARSWHKIP